MVLNQAVRSIFGAFVGIVVAISGLAVATDCKAEQFKPAIGQFVVTSRIYPALGREDELEARLIREAELARKMEPQCTFQLHRSVSEPVFFIFYQIYPSRAVFEKRHADTMHSVHKKLGPHPEGITARLSEIEYFRVLAD
jgi:quinol monooxygenase YgiN